MSQLENVEGKPKKAGPPSKEEREKNRLKYEHIYKIYSESVTPEGTHKFSLKALCRKHKTSYVGILNWVKKNDLEVDAPTMAPASQSYRFQPTPKPDPERLIVGQNRIIIKIDDLATLVSTLVRDNIKATLRQWEKERRINIID